MTATGAVLSFQLAQVHAHNRMTLPYYDDLKIVEILIQ